MNLVDLFTQDRLLMSLGARDMKGAIREMVQSLVETKAVTDDVGKKIEKEVSRRESDASTGIGKGLAIPHAKNCPYVSEVLAVFGRSRDGINFNSVDGGLAHLIFLVVSPVEQSDKHLQVMKKIAAMHRDEKTLKFLITRANAGSVLEILREVDESFE